MTFSKIFQNLFIATFFLYTFQSFAQDTLDQSFLEGLPESIKDQVKIENSLNKEEELTTLFRSETSIEKNKVILNRLKAEIIALDKKLSNDESMQSNKDLFKFGANFFNTLQSSFMPIKSTGSASLTNSFSNDTASLTISSNCD